MGVFQSKSKDHPTLSQQKAKFAEQTNLSAEPADIVPSVTVVTSVTDFTSGKSEVKYGLGENYGVEKHEHSKPAPAPTPASSAPKITTGYRFSGRTFKKGSTYSAVPSVTEGLVNEVEAGEFIVYQNGGWEFGDNDRVQYRMKSPRPTSGDEWPPSGNWLLSKAGHDAKMYYGKEPTRVGQRILEKLPYKP